MTQFEAAKGNSNLLIEAVQKKPGSAAGTDDMPLYSETHTTIIYSVELFATQLSQSMKCRSAR